MFGISRYNLTQARYRSGKILIDSLPSCTVRITRNVLWQRIRAARASPRGNAEERRRDLFRQNTRYFAAAG